MTLQPRGGRKSILSNFAGFILSDIAISVERLSKSYLVGHNTKTESYTALRDVLSRNARNLARKTRDMIGGRAVVQGDEIEEFWALKDVSFDVKSGDRVGIIGRNGAGKSTLLKILSRITEPTEGRVTITGRVASLLEVGTGFHPELTGRENIFLNGAVLGMTQVEIARKFDEIVDFSGVERFIDTPIKRYSSGMQVRLAFAVAAHLEPEILLVDEVLAVGDAVFQRKCLNKMDSIGKSGRTIFFVSHHLRSVQSLCNRALLLREGKLVDEGHPNDIVQKYLQENKNLIAKYIPEISLGDEVVKLISAGITNENGMTTTEFDVQDPIYLEIAYLVTGDSGFNLTPNFRVMDAAGEHVFISAEIAAEGAAPKEVGKSYISRCRVPANLLNEGAYSVTVVISTVELHRPHIFAKEAMSFQILDAMLPGGARHPAYTGDLPGAIRPLLVWETEELK